MARLGYINAPQLQNAGTAITNYGTQLGTWSNNNQKLAEAKRSNETMEALKGQQVANDYDLRTKANALTEQRLKAQQDQYNIQNDQFGAKMLQDYEQNKQANVLKQQEITGLAKYRDASIKLDQDKQDFLRQKEINDQRTLMGAESYAKLDDGSYVMYLQGTSPLLRKGSPITKEAYNSYVKNPKSTAMNAYQQMMIADKQADNAMKAKEYASKLGMKFDKDVAPLIDNWDDLTPLQQQWMKNKYISSDGAYSPKVVGIGGFAGFGQTYSPQGYTPNGKQTSDEDLIKAINSLAL